MADDGTSLGAALYHVYQGGAGASGHRKRTMFLGASFGPETVGEAL